jgi:5-dehydro-4-deoxyglucarate dehydratase
MYSMTPDEIVEVVRVTVNASAGRMPVVAGTGFNTPIGCDIAKRVERAGAELLLVLPPYYSNSPQDGLFAFYEAIGKSCDLPLMVYSRDWAVFTPEMVARLSDRVPTLAAWKDGQGDGRKYQRIMDFNADRLAWYGGLGDDCVPTYFAAGVQAYTSSISNIAPKLSLELAEAGMARDFGRLDTLMKNYVHPLYALRERARGYEVAVMKSAMEMIGRKAGPVRPPLMNTRQQDMADLRKIMEAYGDYALSNVAAATR